MTISKLLIANRGEIAVRIIKACREMGIKTVAVYSDADEFALHTRLADEAVRIGPSAPTESYLRGEAIIKVAQQTNCQAIHPGFGFLAENLMFAEAVCQAGLIYIGPTPNAIRTMGSKLAAREAIQAVGVPIVPGYQESNLSADLLSAAEDIGFPLLIKASAGGGGKGMRLVESSDEMSAALAAARREAQHAFADDTVYLEKYISQPHHIEFQIFGHGNGIISHLFERECSIQRRHQKIIEETPSPLLDEALRQRMGQAAIQAAQAVDYTNAGTVEFLVDGQSKNFYFLEMNTRLQVEHPITEMVTGIDLVKWQIRTAAGQTIPQATQPPTSRGHALECRIYAEDPSNGFLPSTGKLFQVIEPTGPHIRVDSGISSGDEVTRHYDPMLAKLVVWAESRAEAINKMRYALQNYTILGEVTTNIPFLLAVINHPAFATGDTPTDFLTQHLADWSPTELPAATLIAATLFDSLAVHTQNGLPAKASEGDMYTPWQAASQFRI